MIHRSLFIAVVISALRVLTVQQMAWVIHLPATMVTEVVAVVVVRLMAAVEVVAGIKWGITGTIPGQVLALEL